MRKTKHRHQQRTPLLKQALALLLLLALSWSLVSCGFGSELERLDRALSHGPHSFQDEETTRDLSPLKRPTRAPDYGPQPDQGQANSSGRRPVSEAEEKAAVKETLDHISSFLDLYKLPAQDGPTAYETNGVLPDIPFWKTTHDMDNDVKNLIAQNLDNCKTTFSLVPAIKGRQFPSLAKALEQINYWLADVNASDPRYFYLRYLSYTDPSEGDQQGFTYEYIYQTTPTGKIYFTTFDVTIGIKPEFLDEDVRAQTWDRLSSSMDNIAQVIMDYTTNDYARLRLAHDYIAHKTKYDPRANYLTNNALGWLDGDVTMCVGYAQAFNMIAHRMGFESYVVGGEIATDDNEESHAWNKVLLYGKWYDVDVTWDDYDVIDDIMAPRHIWFLGSDEGFAAEHTLSRMPWPKSASDYLDYHQINGLIADDSDQMADIIHDFLERWPQTADRLYCFDFIAPPDFDTAAFDQLFPEVYYAMKIPVASKRSDVIHDRKGYCSITLQ